MPGENVKFDEKFVFFGILNSGRGHIFQQLVNTFTQLPKEGWKLSLFFPNDSHTLKMVKIVKFIKPNGRHMNLLRVYP